MSKLSWTLLLSVACAGSDPAAVAPVQAALPAPVAAPPAPSDPSPDEAPPPPVDAEPAPAPAPEPVPAPAPAPGPSPAQPAPTKAGSADGAACLVSAECTSGVCEGLGCDEGHPGVCAPAQRACTRDRRPYCSCSGETFFGSGSCPGQRFSKRGACAAP